MKAKVQAAAATIEGLACRAAKQDNHKSVIAVRLKPLIVCDFLTHYQTVCLESGLSAQSILLDRLIKI